MSANLAISLDAMGGDNAPEMVIRGADIARQRFPAAHFLFFGDEARLNPMIKRLPGLNAKYWLCDPERNIYGGVYLWRDRAAMEAYEETELFARLANSTHYTQLTVRDFAIFEHPTRVTRGFGTLPADASDYHTRQSYGSDNNIYR